MERFRSWLFSPASAARRCLKALTVGADQVIWDLEDGVPENQKNETRKQLNTLVAQLGPEQMPWVRINSPFSAWGEDDFLHVKSIMAERPLRLVIPKVDASIIRWFEEQNLPAMVQWLLIVESAKGLWDLLHATSPWFGAKNVRLAFGALDYQADVGGSIDPEETELLMLRQQIVMASRALGFLAPIDAVYARFDSTNQVQESARRSRNLGFVGKMVIHPHQVEPVHAAFEPTEQERIWATKVMQSTSQGGAINIGGEMIDGPLIERARQILSVPIDPGKNT